MTVRVKREKESQIEYYGAASGELLGSSAGVRTSVTITATDDYLIIVPKNGPNKTQVEQGSFPTSYIKTEGSQVTRSADICGIDTDQFGYNQKAGTVVVEFNTTAAAGQDNAQYVLSSGNNCHILYSNAGSSEWYAYDGSSVSAYTFVEPMVFGSDPIKAAYADAGNGSSVYHSGTSGTPSSTSSVFDKLQTNQKFDIGSFTGITGFLNGHIKSIKYYPRRLTNEQLQELTS